jgi:hypothetical protein
MNTYRLIFFVGGVFSAIFFSPWITAICIVALAVRYRAVEAIVLGSILDFMWLPHDTLLYSFPLCTLIAAFIVWGFEPLRLEFLR